MTIAVETLITYADEVSGCFEFTDGTQFFWTEGRGGFVVEGGLGCWPVGGGDPWMREMMEHRSELANKAVEDPDQKWESIEYDSMDNHWKRHHIKNMKEAFQSKNDGKYALKNLIEELEENLGYEEHQEVIAKFWAGKEKDS